MIKKLNSNRGASLIIALVYFVVSMSIGAAILSMALANISRVKAEKKMENSYLAVRSAAELYQEKIASINAAGNTEYRMNPDTVPLNDEGKKQIKTDLRKKIKDDSKLPLPTELSKLIYDVFLSNTKDVFLSNTKSEDIFLNYNGSSIGCSNVQAQIFIVPDVIVSAAHADQMQVKVYAVFSPEGENLKDEEKCYITVEGTGIINYQLTENFVIEYELDSEGNPTTEEIEHYSYEANAEISVKDFYTYKGKYTADTGG